MQRAEASAPLISVIVPAYGAAEFIAATLDSALAQTFQDFEVIVVNDGSPDSEELEKVLEPYRSRIVYLRQENQGLAGARNTGIRAARGEYIAPLDADDLWYPEHLAAQLAVLEADPAIDMVYADALSFGDSPEAGKTVMELAPSVGEVTFESLVARECTVTVSACLIRREILFRAGLFDSTLRRTEDFDMWLRMVRIGGRISYQRKVLAQYRRRGGSLSADRVAMTDSFLSVLEKSLRAPGLTARERQVVEREINAGRARGELEKGKLALLAGDAEAAIGHFSASNVEQKSWKVNLALMLLRVAPGSLQMLYRWRDRHVYKRLTPAGRNVS